MFSDGDFIQYRGSTYVYIGGHVFTRAVNGEFIAPVEDNSGITLERWQAQLYDLYMLHKLHKKCQN